MERRPTPYCLRIRYWWSAFHDVERTTACSQNALTTVTEPKLNVEQSNLASCHVDKSTCHSRENCRQDGRLRKLSKSRKMDNLFDLLIPKVYADSLAASETEILPHGLKEQTVQKTVAEKLSEGKPKIFISDQEIQQYLSQETGRDRVRAMFTKVNNEPSPEMALVVSAAQHAGGLAFLIWSILGAREARERFVRKNVHTKFLTKFRAARAYNDTLFVNALRVGFIWGFKVFFFSGLFLTTSQTIAVYRNKSSVMEYAAGGTLTCSLLRINLGLKGMFAGGVIGALMGLFAGGLICGMMWINNETQDQRHYWQVQELLRKQQELHLLNPSDSSQQPQDQKVAN